MMRVLLGVIAGLLLLLPLAAQEVTRDLVREVLDASHCQQVLPSGESLGAEAAEPGARTRRSGSRSGMRMGVMPSLGGLSTVLLWAFVTVVVMIMLATIVRSRRDSGRRVVQKDAAVRVRNQEVAGEPEPESIPEHARLAGAGDFEAAMHATLLHAFAACARVLGAVPPHATGRQLVRLASQHTLSVEDLSQLVSAVERVHFGGQPADRELYEASCRRLQQWELACRAKQ